MTGAMPSGNWSSPFAYVCAPPGTSSFRRAPSCRDRSSGSAAAESTATSPVAPPRSVCAPASTVSL